MDLIRKAVTLAAEPGTKPRTLKFTISTGDVDRMGDTIDPHGWNFAEWQADGAPVLFGHRQDVPPIGRGIEIGVVGDRVKSVVEFPPAGLYPLADDVFNLARTGFLRNASVGFQSTESTYNDATGGRHFLRQVLREWSIVPVPALAQAKIEAALGVGAAVEKWFGSPQLVDDDEPVLHILDDTRRRIWRSWEPAAEPVLPIKDDAEGVLELADDTVRVDLSDLRAAFTQVVTEAIVAELGRRRGDPDFCASRPVGRGRR